MPNYRPLECPICGHDRLERRQRQTVGEAGQLGPRVPTWVCRLCAHSWAEPPASRVDAWS